MVFGARELLFLIFQIQKIEHISMYVPNSFDHSFGIVQFGAPIQVYGLWCVTKKVDRYLVEYIAYMYQITWNDESR